MKKIKISLLAITGALLMMSCNNAGFKKTKSGLLYKITTDGKSDLVKKGEFLKINIIEKVRDSILYSSYGSMPVYLRVDSGVANYSPAEVFSLLHKNDSCVIVQSIDSLQKKSGGPLPPFFKKKDNLYYYLKVADVFKTEDLVRIDRLKEMDKEKDREAKEVADYVAKNKINATKTEKGTWVQVNDPGTGVAVDSGKQVSVLYTGKLFPSGKVFESNITGPNKQPYKVLIGQRKVIPGWDDGLRAFKKGGKGTLYIPAFLAYDAQPGPGNKPFESLIFDIEITDVTDAPVVAAKPVGPMNPVIAAPKKGQPQGH